MSTSLENTLRRGSPPQLVEALLELLDAPEPALLPLVLPLLRHPNPSVRGVAAEALGAVGPDHADAVAPALIVALTDRDALVRSAAAESLGLLRAADAAEALVALLRGDAEELPRTSAAEALGDLGDAAHLPALVQALRDRSPLVRMAAAASLGALHDPAALAPLRQARPHEGVPEVALELTTASWRLGDREALAALEEVAHTCDEDLALNVINVLGGARWRPPASLEEDLPRLRGALEHVVGRFPRLEGDGREARARLG